jgi:hypothetical protein
MLIEGPIYDKPAERGARESSTGSGSAPIAFHAAAAKLGGPDQCGMVAWELALFDLRMADVACDVARPTATGLRQ